MSAVVEAVEGVVNGIDKYVIEPIKNDPLTFIATVAAATFLGPAAATMFGTNLAIGTGIAAAAGNTVAGLAQGESFDEAIKGGAIAGLTTWGGAELSGLGKIIPNAPGTAPIVEGIAGVADDAVFSGSSSYFKPTTGGAPYGANSGLSLVDEAATAGGGGGASLTPADLSSGVSSRPFDAASMVDDVFTQAGPKPVIPSGSPTGALSPIAQADVTGGVYKSVLEGVDDAALSGLDDAALQGGSGRYADILTDKKLDFVKSPYDVGTNPSLYQSGQVGASGLKVSTPDLASQYPSAIGGDIGVPSTWDKVVGYGKDAYKLVVDNPAYSIPLALTAASYLGGKDGPPDGGGGGGNQGQIGSPDFYEPLQQYEMKRSQLNPNDLENYGEVGGEQRFFTPTVYEPVQYANGGSVMPQQDKYGYYTYGQIPQTMRGFARGGLSSLAKPSSFDGRSDDIPAVLSDGEFVIDAETVALLGNGSSDAGANRLEEMRRAVRKQKGGALSQGKISSDAKHPLAYLKSSKKSRG